MPAAGTPFRPPASRCRRYRHQAGARRRRTHCSGTPSLLSRLHDDVDAGGYRLADRRSVLSCRATPAVGCIACHHRGSPQYLCVSPGPSSLRVAGSQDVAALLAQSRGVALWLILRGIHRLHAAVKAGCSTFRLRLRPSQRLGSSLRLWVSPASSPAPSSTWFRRDRPGTWCTRPSTSC